MSWLAVGLALCVSAVGSPAQTDRVRQYTSYALQGDLTAVPALFDGVDEAELSRDDAELLERFRARFVRRSEEWEELPASPFIHDVVAAYREYWTEALMGRLPGDEGELFLKQRLRSVLAVHELPPASAEGDDILVRVGEEIEQQGLHHIGGITLPLFDLMLWSSQDSVAFDVELTDTVQPVTVIFVSDFLVKGWSHFATFGRAYTGGWAAQNALYCLREDYDLESEKFLISYLKHESRHFADYAEYPALEQIDLEYRAKLTELAYAQESIFDLLQHFAASGDPNPNAPHAYANFAVVRDVASALFGEEASDATRFLAVEARHINAAARGLLATHTVRLVAAGADTARGVVYSP